jgi:DNA-binding MarR family transcriptional regulator
VARAERAGLVQRADAGNGSRTVIVTLAPAGHALVESLVDRVLYRETELISCLTPPQRAALTELLRLLLDDVQGKVGLPAGAERTGYTQVGSS